MAHYIENAHPIQGLPHSRVEVSRLTLAIAVAAILMPGGHLLAQAGAGDLPRFTVRLSVDSIALLRLSPALRPGGRLRLRSTPQVVAALWELETRALLEKDRARRRRARLLASLSTEPVASPPTVPAPEAVAPRPEDIAAVERGPLRETLTDYADLGLDMNARLELKVDQLRNARCTAADAFSTASGCVGGFPTPSFDQQFNVRAGGIVGDRVHVNVDFDTEREFNANNNINVYYEGLEDEILRRIEVGTVSFRAPASRFITSGIPANSFGVQAEAQLGPLSFRSIVAQQKGSAVRTRRFTVGDAATQPIDFEARDLDFEAGRFFFVVNPLELPGYPDVDVLTLNREILSGALRLADVRVYRLRAQGGQVEINPNLGGIDAVAIRRDSPQRVGPFSWELMVEGLDYYLDASGVWFALSSRVGAQDFLAVSYITTAGDTVGTFPTVNGQGDTLELIYEPHRGPEVPTFPYEMRNAYRVGGQGIDRNSIELALLVHSSETPLDQSGTYLSRLGLALSTDPSTLDEFNRIFPRIRDPGGGAPIRDLFVIFPHLTPFADSVRLQAGERSDSLYRTPTFLLRTQGPAPRFALQIHYEASGAGDRTTLSLGAIQVRLGSERIYVAGRQLIRGQEYDIDYALGQVTFLNPDSLFAGPTQVRAEFEENQLFDDAPKSIFGFSSTYSLGPSGDIHAIGIFQRERTASTRPILGFEPEGEFIGGLSADLHFRPHGVTRLLDALPMVSTSVPSALEINGEVALSQPSSNQTGVAYIEDFEGEPSSRIPLAERAFQLGSIPSAGRGLPLTHLGPGGNFVAADAVPLVWQNLVPAGTGVLQFSPQDIDTTIVLAGTGVSVETVLWLSLKPDTIGGAPDPTTGRPRWLRPRTPGPRWRSITHPLGGGSGVGIDLSRTEFLEFWVLEDAERSGRRQNAYLIFDFGTVFEDAVDFGPTSFRIQGADTTFAGFQFLGDGRLDTEKDTLTNVFNAQLNDVGIRGDLVDAILNEGTGDVLMPFPLCDLRGKRDVTVFPLGDLLARCSRGNGVLNTEDLDGDNRLDVKVGTLQEDFVRYVFPVGDLRFFVRTGGTHVDNGGRMLTWRLYRIPFREDTVQVGQPNLRQIQGLRMTVVAPDQAGPEQEFSIALARMRLIGAPWIKRAATPIAGLSGSRGEPRGEVIASVVTTENTDLGYEPPPGIFNAPEQAAQVLGFGSRQINEKSLRLLATGLAAGQRAEALLRFVSTADKNFLKYRKLRVWGRGRGAGWEGGDLEFFIKVGRDEHNFYMYKTPIRSVTWEPEVVVDLERWTKLRAAVEAAWLIGEPPSGAAQCGGDSTAYVACDGPYFVQMRDPGISPPNLARVSEVAVGMFRAQESVPLGQAELWADDIRLTDVIDDPGLAAALDVRFAAADVAELTFAYSRTDDRFRQLGEDPRYITDAVLQVGSVLSLDKLLPARWGLSVPMRVQHTRTSADPFYIEQTDVLADALPNLRRPHSSVTSFELSLRRVQRGTSFLERVVLDPLFVRVRRNTGNGVHSLSTARTTNQQFHVDYSTSPRSRTVRVVPQFLIDFVNSLPGFLRNSEFAEALRSARLRWNPQRLRLSSTLTDNLTERATFRVPVELAGDSLITPSRRITHRWRNAAELDLRPFSSLGIRVTYESTRDLQDYGDSTSLGRVLREKQRKLLGADVGFERTRRLTTGIDVAPVLSAWLRPRLIVTSTFNFNRDPNAPAPVRANPDSSGAFRASEAISSARTRELGATVDIARLARGLVGESGSLATVLRGVLPADFSFVRELRSNFNDITFSPDLQYHLALGGLDEFRDQEGVLATSAMEITGLTATGGSRLPLGAQVRVNYRTGRNTIWFSRTEGQQKNEQRTREWPSFTASWVYTPRSSLRTVVSSVSAQMQYRVLKRSSIQPRFDALGDADATEEELLTEDNTKVLSPSVTLIWPGGVTTSGSFSTTTSERVTSGNTTNTDRLDWNGTVGFGFRLPESLMQMRSQIRTTVSFSSSKRAVCLIRVGSDECRTVSDSRRQQFDLRLDTGLSETLRGGATFSYVVSDLRHTSDKLTQVVFSIFLDLRLFAGEIR